MVEDLFLEESRHPCDNRSVTPVDIKARFLSTLSHVAVMSVKLKANTGPGRAFSFPDQHKFSEGLFLTCWTHWEEFIRELLVADLATDRDGFVLRDVRQFRVQGAPWRLAEAVLFHPDHPEKFVEWDFGYVKSRAETFLPVGHRFTGNLPRQVDLDRMKRIRNAIAHKSDRAWISFIKLAQDVPFNLNKNQMRGITVGRFIAAHTWNGNDLIEESINVFRGYATFLVP